MISNLPWQEFRKESWRTSENLENSLWNLPSTGSTSAQVDQNMQSGTHQKRKRLMSIPARWICICLTSRATEHEVHNRTSFQCTRVACSQSSLKEVRKDFHWMHWMLFVTNESAFKFKLWISKTLKRALNTACTLHCVQAGIVQTIKTRSC